MKEELPIAYLIRSRAAELGLSRGQLLRRFGKNANKTARRLDELCKGDLGSCNHLIKALPQALELPSEAVQRAMEETRQMLDAAARREAAAREQVWRDNFEPHAVIVTERSVPSPIFVAALMGPERLLTIKLDSQRGRQTYFDQARAKLPDYVPAFGKPIGLVINYSPDVAVRFDLAGNPIEALAGAVRVADAVLSLRGRPISPGEMDALIGPIVLPRRTEQE